MLPVVLTIIITEFIPKRYTSSITLLCPEILSGTTVSTGGGISSILSSFKKVSGAGFTTQDLKILVNSDYMCLDIIKKFNIQKLYKIKKIQDAVEFVRKKLINMDVLGEDGVVIISVTSINPKLSENIVQFIYNDLNKINSKLKFTTKTPLTRIVSRPYIPLKKSYPSMKLNVSIALLFGILISLIYIYFDIMKSNDRKNQ